MPLLALPLVSEGGRSSAESDYLRHLWGTFGTMRYVAWRAWSGVAWPPDSLEAGVWGVKIVMTALINEVRIVGGYG